MAEGPVIDRFVPPEFSRQELDLAPLEALFHKQLQFAVNGRSALYHILLANPSWRKILVPTYVCASVLIPLRKAGVEPVFFDVDPQDLNGDLESLEQFATRGGVSAVLLPSMYGNPAELQRAQALCSSLGLFLIDDAAQSFGASLDGQPVGTFGNAGFFSCSPGKPLAGHMGAFYWADQPPVIKRTARLAALPKMVGFSHPAFECLCQSAVQRVPTPVGIRNRGIDQAF
jgi:dTDP-4-amino-4,6-dideoxygalactose transaminase